MRWTLAAVAASSAPLIAIGAQAKRAFTPADWYKLTTLSAPAMSPDGGRVAFTVQTINERDNKYHREVWVVPVSGGAPMRFTSPSTESSNPRWSPDGKYLMFTSNRPGGKGTTWMLRMDQPGGEAFQQESYPRGTTATRDGRLTAWSDADSTATDSTRRGDDPYAKMQAMARPPYGAITKPLDPARFDGRHVYDMRYKSNDQGFLAGAREARRWRPAQVWVQAFDGSAKRRITDTRYSHRNVAVSPDGQSIAFIADARLRPDSVVEMERDSLAQLPYDKKRDDVDRNDVDVYVMPISGDMPRKVATLMGNESDLTWSPDSKRIAFVTPVFNDAARGPGFEPGGIYVVERDGTGLRRVSPDRAT
jgi:Tol biopolymer transport system component